MSVQIRPKPAQANFRNGSKADAELMFRGSGDATRWAPLLSHASKSAIKGNSAGVGVQRSGSRFRAASNRPAL
jgi:hypothetical protein